MSEPTYTQREMMDFHFKRFDEKLDDIRLTLSAQNRNSEKRFETLEADVQNLKTFQIRVMSIWATITFCVTLVASRFI